MQCKRHGYQRRTIAVSARDGTARCEWQRPRATTAAGDNRRGWSTSSARVHLNVHVRKGRFNLGRCKCQQLHL